MFSKISQHVLSLPIMRSRGDWLIAAAWSLIIVAGVCRANDAAATDVTEDTAPALSELSVPPIEFPAYPDDRPDWIDQPPELDGAVHQWPVISVPSLNRERSRESLRQQTRSAIALYADHLFEDHHSGRPGIPFDIKESWVEMSLDQAGKGYRGTVQTSDGEMFEEAVLLQFDDAFQDVLRKEWRSQEVGRRLTGLGILGGGSMALMIAFSSVLRWAGSRKRQALR